jgi:hypothetical protein
MEFDRFTVVLLIRRGVRRARQLHASDPLGLPY